MHELTMRPDAPKSHEELLKYYDYRIKVAIKCGTIRLVLAKMIGNQPKYQYLQNETQNCRIISYLRAAMLHGISLSDLIHVMAKHKIREPRLLHMSVETHRNDIFNYFIQHNKDFYLHKDYKTDVDLVISAGKYNVDMISDLAFSPHKIDVWNPPKYVDNEEHFSYMWKKMINRDSRPYSEDSVHTIYHDLPTESNIIIMEFFRLEGADINRWFYNPDWPDGRCRDASHYSPLTYAMSVGELSAAEYLMLEGAHLNNPIFPATFVAVRYGLHFQLDLTLTHIYCEINHNNVNIIIDDNGQNRIRRFMFFMILRGANPYVNNHKGQNIYQYIDEIMDFDIERDPQFQDQEKDAEFHEWHATVKSKFEKWHPEEVTRIKDITRAAISDASNILKSNRQIVAKSMDMVMKLMVMSGQIRSNQILSGNIMSIVMEFHGGLGNPLNMETLQLGPESLSGLRILLEKRQFLLSYKLGNKLGHKKHYEKLGFLEKKGGILHQKEGNLGQKKCDLPAMDVRNEQNMDECTEEVCKNVQKTIKNSTFLNNLDVDSISIVETYLNTQHHNVRSVAFNSMSAMLDDTLIAQAEWYVREGRALNTFATAVANGDVTVISEPSAINEAVHIAEIVVSPDSETNLGREATSQITTVDEAPNDDIIAYSNDILSQAMDLIHGLHFDTALTSSSHYAL